MPQSIPPLPWNLPEPPDDLWARCAAPTATQADFAEFFDHCDVMIAELRRRHRREFATMLLHPTFTRDLASEFDALADAVPPPLPPRPKHRDDAWDRQLARWFDWLDRFDTKTGELARFRSANAVASAPLTLPR